MRFFVIQLVVLIVTGANLFAPTEALSQSKDRKPLIVGIYNWAPYVGKDLKNGGFAADLVQTALARKFYESAIVFLPFARLLKGVEIGKYDIIPGAWYTKEREKYMMYGASFAINKLVIINHEKYDFDYRTLDDLKGETVGISLGYAYPQPFMDADYFYREEALDLESNLRKLVYGRVNLIIGDEMVARYTAERNFKGAAGLIEYANIAIEENPLYFGISRKTLGHEHIAKVFKVSLEQMHKDGTYLKILKRHNLEGAFIKAN